MSMNILGRPIGTSVSVFSHFGELVQGPVLQNGDITYTLVSLPCPKMVTSFELTDVELQIPGSLTRNLWARLHNRFGVRHRFSVKKLTSLPAGKGLGTSTADLYCAAKLFNAVYNVFPSAQAMFKFATAGAVASDPIYIKRPTLFAQQDRYVLEPLPTTGRIIHMLGTFSKARHVVDTKALSHRAYTVEHLLTYRCCLRHLRDGLMRGDLDLIARGCCLSAEMNSDFVPLADLSSLWRLAQAANSAGYCVSHSGSAIAFMFGDGQDRAQATKKLMDQGYETLEFDARL